MSERKLTINQRLNIRQRRRKALHELHAQKLLTARLLRTPEGRPLAPSELREVA